MTSELEIGAGSDERSIDVTEPSLFRDEQLSIAANCWTLIGFLDDLNENNAWVTATLGGTEVFVQRFGESIRGFENYCAHRYFPLRQGKKGKGPIRCGFHGWLYDERGAAAGIPLANEVFGCDSSEVGRALAPIDVGVCGPLVFGRLRRDIPHADTVDEHVGRAADFLRALVDPMQLVGDVDQTIAANWKVCYQITLDDYHIVAVHPDSVGKSGHPAVGESVYFKFGRHSALAVRRGSVLALSDEEFLGLARASPLPVDYAVLHLFPNTLISLSGDGTVCVSSYRATDLTRTQHLARIYYRPAGKKARLSEEERAARLQSNRRIFEQDQHVVELLQTRHAAGKGIGLLGAREQRIGTFLTDVDNMVRDTRVEKARVL